MKARELEQLAGDLRRFLDAEPAQREAVGVRGDGSRGARPRIEVAMAADLTSDGPPTEMGARPRSRWVLGLALVSAATLGFALRPYFEPRRPEAVGLGDLGSRLVHTPPAEDPLRSAHSSGVSSEVPSEVPSGVGDSALAEAGLDLGVAVADGWVDLPTAAPEAGERLAAPDSLGVASSAPSPFERAAFEGRLHAADVAPHAYLPVDGPACAYFESTTGAGSGALDLGPCLGPLTVDGAAVAGMNRVNGVPCCLHHQLAERLGGDRERLARAAAEARAEGTLPPLLAARIERAAVLFLRARFGTWHAVGLDVLAEGGQCFTCTPEGRAHVATWVELDADRESSTGGTGGTGALERRGVELEFELRSGPRGDALLSLVIGDELRAAAAATREPGSLELSPVPSGPVQSEQITTPEEPNLAPPSARAASDTFGAADVRRDERP